MICFPKEKKRALTLFSSSNVKTVQKIEFFYVYRLYNQRKMIFNPLHSTQRERHGINKIIFRLFQS